MCTGTCCIIIYHMYVYDCCFLYSNSCINNIIVKQVTFSFHIILYATLIVQKVTEDALQFVCTPHAGDRC